MGSVWFAFAVLATLGPSFTTTTVGSGCPKVYWRIDNWEALRQGPLLGKMRTQFYDATAIWQRYVVSEFVESFYSSDVNVTVRLLSKLSPRSQDALQQTETIAVTDYCRVDVAPLGNATLTCARSEELFAVADSCLERVSPFSRAAIRTVAVVLGLSETPKTANCEIPIFDDSARISVAVRYRSCSREPNLLKQSAVGVLTKNHSLLHNLEFVAHVSGVESVWLTDSERGHSRRRRTNDDVEGDVKDDDRFQRFDAEDRNSNVDDLVGGSDVDDDLDGEFDGSGEDRIVRHTKRQTADDPCTVECFRKIINREQYLRYKEFLYYYNVMFYVSLFLLFCFCLLLIYCVIYCILSSTCRQRRCYRTNKSEIPRIST